MGPLQRALSRFSIVCGTANTDIEEMPQCKPRHYTRMNEKAEGFNADYESDEDKYVQDPSHREEAETIWKEIEDFGIVLGKTRTETSESESSAGTPNRYDSVME
ncbi:uncharacterized protein K460DRAFT_368601 [Cucurbitaria berberidis CBS 394.84]|uniref:Uncharacterized protein n=1 Tax=Cucurbitaria berberidis CBS 394.84 TaxID=1168544 RepID=A0A9P4GE72_9PLEO|nr:uncharacterized protein K460DRAFT_368601 [Cucurbitaria berberidis CBS 394.84]KAF1843747.1 hypothetical protein K460DRAFT_368601 [Cucurbitaria berberidis CBS 394.84]